MGKEVLNSLILGGKFLQEGSGTPFPGGGPLAWQRGWGWRAAKDRESRLENDLNLAFWVSDHRDNRKS